MNYIRSYGIKPAINRIYLLEKQIDYNLNLLNNHTKKNTNSSNNRFKPSKKMSFKIYPSQ